MNAPMKKWRGWLGTLVTSRLVLLSTGAQEVQVALNPDSGGAVEISVSGPPGGWYVIEASPDMLNWSLLAKAQGNTEAWKYVDYVAPVFLNRFYRASRCGVPVNDNFPNRQILRGTNLHVAGWNFNATTENGEPALATLEQGSNSVWWSWTSPGQGTVSISTIGTFWDTLIAVFTGEKLNHLVPVAQVPWHTRALNFPVKAGVTYQIGIAGSDDQAGPLSLSLNFQPGNPLPGISLEGASVHLIPFQSPNVENYALMFSDDAKECNLDFIADPGSQPEVSDIVSYRVEKSVATVDLKDKTDPNISHRFQFSFITGNSGTYVHNVDDGPADVGEFTNFRSKAEPLALKSLTGAKLTGTRVWTSTGTSGQSHHYTFDYNGHFHDSDSPEQATGRYQYAAHDAQASLILDYTGPADFAGDHHELAMTFTTVNGGTFTSHYAKNDGTQITILGDFVIDED